MADEKKELFDDPVSEEMTVRFAQKADDGAPKDECGFQDIEVSLETIGAGMYFVIKTNRWAFDKIDDLVLILEKVRKAAETMGGEVPPSHGGSDGKES